MKKVIIILSAFFAFAFLHAAGKDTWQIRISKQVIFEGNSDAENTTVSLRSIAFKKSDCLVIKYNMETADTSWKRTFYIKNSNDRNIKTARLSKQAGIVSVDASVINELMNKKEPVFIYTISLPKSRQLAARVRVRRVLMCKIEWN